MNVDIQQYQSVPEHLKWVHQYFYNLDNETMIKKNREQYRDSLKELLMNNYEQDDRGNYYWEFDTPITSITGTEYRGIMAQRRVSEYTDDERARKLIELHGLQDRCIREVVLHEVDLDELYACNQEGIISDDEIDSIIDIEESWSLVRVKA